MVFNIYLNDELVNALVSSDVSFVDAYCNKHGYTYTKVQRSESAEPQPSDHEILMTLLGVNE